jgi:hypothetical protein
MSSFNHRMAPAVDHPGTKGWLVAILELGAWFGVLMTGNDGCAPLGGKI